MTRIPAKGLSPESEDPKPKTAESNTTSAKPAALTDEKYHELSDAYMDEVLQRMEQLQEERDDVDVEYSVSLLLPFSIPPFAKTPVLTSNNRAGRRSEPRLPSHRHICH